LLAVVTSCSSPGQPNAGQEAVKPSSGGVSSTGLPRLLDLGSDKCIPCKQMAPILEELKKDLAGKLTVEFIDVVKDKDAAKKYGVETIPTQIFYDASGKELQRHTGFFSREEILAKWKELGVDLGLKPTALIREEPLQQDARPKEQVCSLCEKDLNPKTSVKVDAPWGKASLCSVHCYAIYFSSLVDATQVKDRATVTDAATGQSVPIETAFYAYSFKEGGRPAITAYATAEAAKTATGQGQGQVLAWEDVLKKELAVRCGFCDRAVYPEDACSVKADGVSTCGCCPMCGLGVAARLKKDIELTQKDALTGETVTLTTLDLQVAQLNPPTSVGWHGQRKNKEGKMASAGCFHQFFFTSEANLRTWLEKHPEESGKMVTIGQALADKVKLSPEQIKKACKIGECK
jgi:thioredoxin 1